MDFKHVGAHKLLIRAGVNLTTLGKTKVALADSS